MRRKCHIRTLEFLVNKLKTALLYLNCMESVSRYISRWKSILNSFWWPNLRVSTLLFLTGFSFIILCFSSYFHSFYFSREIIHLRALSFFRPTLSWSSVNFFFKLFFKSFWKKKMTFCRFKNFRCSILWFHQIYCF